MKYNNLIKQCLPYFFSYKKEFFLPKQSQKSRSILQDGSRSLGLFRKGKTRIIAKFLPTDLVICSHSREGKTPSYSQINAVNLTFVLDTYFMNVCNKHNKLNLVVASPSYGFIS